MKRVWNEREDGSRSRWSAPSKFPESSKDSDWEVTCEDTQEGGMAGGWKIPGHLKRLLHPRLQGVLSTPGLEGQLGSADVSVLRPWACCSGKVTGLRRGRPASHEDQLISSAPGSPGDPRADLPVTWQLRGRFHPQTGMEGPGFLGGAGSGREGAARGGGGEALGPRPFLTGRSPAKRWKGRGGPGEELLAGR